MSMTMRDIMNPQAWAAKPAGFPDAPEDWDKTVAEATAHHQDLSLSEDHWGAVRALQNFFAHSDDPSVRELQHVLERYSHAKGGMKFLYMLFPRGPVAQCCRVAGLPVPPSAENMSFGSVQ